MCQENSVLYPCNTQWLNVSGKFRRLSVQHLVIKCRKRQPFCLNNSVGPNKSCTVLYCRDVIYQFPASWTVARIILYLKPVEHWPVVSVTHRRCRPRLYNVYMYFSVILLKTCMDKQSWACDNSFATLWPYYQSTKLFLIAILLYLLWLPHRDTEA